MGDEGLINVIKLYISGITFVPNLDGQNCPSLLRHSKLQSNGYSSCRFAAQIDGFHQCWKNVFFLLEKHQKTIAL